MSSKHKHDRSNGKKPVLELDETRKLLYVNGKKYEWEWGKWVTADVSGQVSHEWKNEWCRVHSNGKREDITSDRKKALLDRRQQRAKREKEQKLEASREFALAMEEARNPSPPAESDSESDSSSAESQPKHQRNKSWQRHTRKPPEGQRVEHTKYGVRVWTLDGKTWWDICVNASDTYPDGTAVRLTLPPPRKDGKRWNMGIFDLEMMEAIRREFARGIQPKAVITPKAVYTAKAKKKAV